MAPSIGAFVLLLAFVATCATVICMAVGVFAKGQFAETCAWSGRIASILAFAAFTVCCGVLVYCFLIGDYSIQYVLDERPSGDNLLYKISGLWAGREGSLLFWAWLISLFTMIVSLRRLNKLDRLDSAAVFVCSLVLLAFAGVLLFSDANIPFTATDSKYYDSYGVLNVNASVLGMNSLLQHWAMAVHPPTLFIGYSGLTVPFAYAIGALIVNDPSKEWVTRSERYALVSWLFLTIGIGLGSVWAYVCLGWGGYWGWDPVENASFLPWLVCVALLHSFKQYKARDAFKIWTVICATLTFAFCIVGTFISRSGLVQSVHAFEGDPVSLALFGALIIVSILVGVIGCIIRRKSFKDPNDEMQSMMSKEGAFYLTNVVMIVMAVLLAYLTIAQALPTFLPFGGESVSSGTYNAIARPMGILFLLLMAVCPLLSWGKTDPKAFWKRARIPGICALVLFVILVVFWATSLLPAYNAIIGAGGTAASELLSEGPSAYYNGLAVFGFLVASLLLFNSLFQLAGALKAHAVDVRAKLPRVGSAVGHLGMAIILVGLIGSNMYVTENSGYLSYDKSTDTSDEVFTVGDYELHFTGSTVGYVDGDTSNIRYEVGFDVYRDGNNMGHIDSSVQLASTTQQRKYNAGVLRLPTEDVFVVYQGVRDSDNALSIEARVNPLVSVVWVGFFVLCLGMLCSIFGRRGPRRKKDAAEAAAEASADVDASDAKLAATKDGEPSESTEALEAAAVVETAEGAVAADEPAAAPVVDGQEDS